MTVESDRQIARQQAPPRRRSKPLVRLKPHQRIALRILAAAQRVWCRTLRFELSPSCAAFRADPPAPLVAVLWHNRLFAAAEFYRRYCPDRKLAALISASRDGAWLAELLATLKIRPVRGSAHNRGAQALRELFQVHAEGYDVAVTPDGSRGPVYEMKPGAAMIALKTGQPLTLLAMNFNSAWRLNSWDRFYLPKPFSKIRVEIKVFPDLRAFGPADADEAVAMLQRELDRMTEDRDIPRTGS